MNQQVNGNGKRAVEVLRCPGDLSASNMAHLKNRFSQVMNRKHRFVLIDLKRARHVDLAGLSILVERIQRFRSIKGDIRLFNLHPAVSETLRMVGVNRVIESYSTEEEARRSFQVA